MANQNNNNQNIAPCGFVTLAECEAHRERLRDRDLELEHKMADMLVSLTKSQQQISLLLKILSVFSGGIVTIATTLILNFII
jgi:type IV secretory pathway VirB6-like protein